MLVLCLLSECELPGWGCLTPFGKFPISGSLTLQNSMQSLVGLQEMAFSDQFYPNGGCWDAPVSASWGSRGSGLAWFQPLASSPCPHLWCPCKLPALKRCPNLPFQSSPFLLLSLPLRRRSSSPFTRVFFPKQLPFHQKLQNASVSMDFIAPSPRGHRC